MWEAGSLPILQTPSAQYYGAESLCLGLWLITLERPRQNAVELNALLIEDGEEPHPSPRPQPHANRGAVGGYGLCDCKCEKWSWDKFPRENGGEMSANDQFVWTTKTTFF